MSIKFVVDMNELRKKINFVRNGLGASKTDLPTLLMRFEVEGTKATIFAASKEAFCRTEMKIKREEGEDAKNGSFAVLGSKLEKLISQVEAEIVSFAADQENLEVKAGFLTVNFETYDGAPVRTVEVGVQEHLKLEGLTVDRGALEEGLACAKSCTTTNSIRPDVTHAELRAGALLSSDGRKIMIYSSDQFPKDVTLKVPASALTDVLTAVKNIDAEKIQVIAGAAYFFIKGNQNEYTMGVRRVERNFPAVETQIRTGKVPDDEISIDKHVLEAMLRGVSLSLAADEVKVTLDVGGAKGEAWVEVGATNNQGRRSHERASASRKQDTKISFPVSFKHLVDTLSVFKGDSVVDMMVLTGNNLLMIRDSTEQREVLTIIPFRTDKQIEAEKKEAEAQAEARKKAQQEADAAEAKAGLVAASEAAGTDVDLEG